MSELILDRDTRLRLKARAHSLKPVVWLGNAGLSDAVLLEIDRALNAHELIKVRVPGEDRKAREAIFSRIADLLSAARVQMIGKLLVLYRPRPSQENAKPPPAAKAPPGGRGPQRHDAAPLAAARGGAARQRAPRRGRPQT
ncbi:MAG: ribosome assembly RNA-binding protein YhbY [Sutterellaceae bacterium]|nr:ribosome assembly RNA-binding protein YhbY [Burkholderiaceae bacterium]MCX7901296.1 ribosome assembly RNA-binding protein YhbY [Burkholderiaceae bacterium]MDW8430441.1 ribosome assembly RNA-binding protein YhbY [Sutterellaceae bacterium]